MKAPTTCLYCDGHGNSTAGGECGFCEGGTPLDTQEDWDNSWGRVHEIMSLPSDGFGDWLRSIGIELPTKED